MKPADTIASFSFPGSAAGAAALKLCCYLVVSPGFITQRMILVIPVSTEQHWAADPGSLHNEQRPNLEKIGGFLAFLGHGINTWLWLYQIPRADPRIFIQY